MFNDQHDCQASFGSNVLLRKPARMRVSLGIPCALAPFLIKETVFLLSDFRQASERQKTRSRLSLADCLLSGARSCWIGSVCLCLGRGVLVTLALAVPLRRRCSSRGEPVTLRVRRVRLNHSEDVRTEKSTLLSSRSWTVVSYPAEPDRLFERMLGCPVGEELCWELIHG